MGKIRVLVADDSAVVRTEVTRWLESDPELEVVGTAANGRQAVERVEARAPDVVLLDVEMPDVDGLAALKGIRERDPRIPVIMFSHLTRRGGMVTLDALALGATDYVPKPSTAAGVVVTPEEARADLVMKIKRLHARAARRFEVPAPRPAARPRASAAARVDAVAIGTSTGGPNALAEVFSAFPAGFPVPVLIVQHMPPVFTRSLAERLSRTSRLHVEEARDGIEPAPGSAWIAPGGRHLVAERGADGVKLRVNDEPPENSCRPSVDVLFRSVANVYGPHSLAVVLTGMGHDGLAGSEAIASAGGEVLAQDEPSSVVWGMPGEVANAGLASRVLPIADVGREIVERVKRGRTAK